jgi:anti-sigma regulatory factor (Ser/Thr protein kinase)
MEFELRCPIGPDLGYIRDLVRVHARHHGLPGERGEDLVAAVNEAVANVLDHGGRAGLVTARAHAHGVTVEILDIGGGLTPDHLAAAHPDPRSPHGFGLWLIQRLCDGVGLEQTGLGSLLTLHMHGDSAPIIPFEQRAGRGGQPRRAAG